MEKKTWDSLVKVVCDADRKTRCIFHAFRLFVRVKLVRITHGRVYKALRCTVLFPIRECISVSTDDYRLLALIISRCYRGSTAMNNTSLLLTLPVCLKNFQY